MKKISYVKHMYNALYYASINGDAETVKWLLDKGADVNLPALNPPIITACFANSINSVKLLIDYKANINDLDYSGNIPLTIAGEKGNIELVQLLLENGANIDSLKGSNSGILSHIIRKGDDENNIELVKLLSAWGIITALIKNYNNSIDRIPIWKMFASMETDLDNTNYFKSLTNQYNFTSISMINIADDIRNLLDLKESINPKALNEVWLELFEYMLAHKLSKMSSEDLISFYQTHSIDYDQEHITYIPYKQSLIRCVKGFEEVIEKVFNNQNSLTLPFAELLVEFDLLSYSKAKNYSDEEFIKMIANFRDNLCYTPLDFLIELLKEYSVEKIYDLLEAQPEERTMKFVKTFERALKALQEQKLVELFTDVEIFQPGNIDIEINEANCYSITLFDEDDNGKQEINDEIIDINPAGEGKSIEFLED